MNSFSISKLQRITGINIHSIRAWEKRYNALKPERTKGNTRYYNGNQLRRLLNIASLMESGYKISEICSMEDHKLHELLEIKIKETNKYKSGDYLLVNQMVASAIEFNETLFHKIFSSSVMCYGLEGAYLKVIYPALQRLGMMWFSDKIAPAQEHFVLNLIRQKLDTSIDMIPLSHYSKEHWLLFLPENEFHEIGLLMAHYLLRNAGHRSTYLGANVPFDSLIDSVEILKPTSLLSFFVCKDYEQNDNDIVQQMNQLFPSQKKFLATEPSRLAELGNLKDITPLHSLNELKLVITDVDKKS
jgi:MerR family transcriptional regulator, light-induced transcriptional regulator